MGIIRESINFSSTVLLTYSFTSCNVISQSDPLINIFLGNYMHISRWAIQWNDTQDVLLDPKSWLLLKMQQERNLPLSCPLEGFIRWGHLIHRNSCWNIYWERVQWYTAVLDSLISGWSNRTSGLNLLMDFLFANKSSVCFFFIINLCVCVFRVKLSK